MDEKSNTALEPTLSKAIYKSQRLTAAAQLDRYTESNKPVKVVYS